MYLLNINESCCISSCSRLHYTCRLPLLCIIFFFVSAPTVCLPFNTDLSFTLSQSLLNVLPKCLQFWTPSICCLFSQISPSVSPLEHNNFHFICIYTQISALGEALQFFIHFKHMLILHRIVSVSILFHHFCMQLLYQFYQPLVTTPLVKTQ